MVFARNPAEVYNTLNESIQIAVEYVMSQILSNYKHLITEIVYGRNPEEYERTYEFLESWQTNTKKTRQGAIGELNQNVSFMSYNPQDFQHGSNYTSYGDVRDELAGIIYQGLGGNLFGEGWWNGIRDPWTPLVKELNSGKLREWFIEGMTRQGFQCRSVGIGKNISSLW